MLSRLHSKLGTAGLVVAVVALVVALTGVAFAAAGLNPKQKKEVKKIAKSVAKPGPQGPTGPQGPAGPAGTKGDKGDPGTNGISPTGTKFTGEKGGCTEGGVEFKGANTTFACNGVEGETGFTEVLPPGETEAGHWAFGLTGPTQQFVAVPVSFVIPYPGTAGPTLNYVEEGDTTNPACPGTAANPLAEPGNLCVYEGTSTQPTFEFEPGLTEFLTDSNLTDPAGTVLGFAIEQGEGGNAKAVLAGGTWAVTAPAGP